MNKRVAEYMAKHNNFTTLYLVYLVFAHRINIVYPQTMLNG